MIIRSFFWLVHLPLQLILASLFALCQLLRPLAGLARPRARATSAALDVGRCTIVMLNWNGRKLLEESLPALRRALRSEDGEHEVLIVDNGSEDDSVAWVKEHFPEFRLLALERNLGFAQGNNRGVQAANSDIVVLLNNDMIVEEGFLSPLLEAFSDPDVFAATAQIFFPAGKRREETGNTQGRIVGGRLELRHDPVGRGHLKRGLLPVLWGGGGSTAFHRSRFLQLGGFSHIFSPVYVEDADLSYRAWRRGWKVLLAARSEVLHKHRSSSSSRFSERQINDMIEERKLWYLWKNFPFSRLLSHFLLFPVHLGRAISPLGYWKSLRKLPAAWLARLKEPSWSWPERDVQEWIAHPLSYLEKFQPQRSQASQSSDVLRILVVSAYLPHLGYHGGAGRVFQLMRQVARRHEVSLATFIETDKEKAETGQAEAFCKRVDFIKRGSFEPVSPFPNEPFEEFNCPRFRRLLESVLLEDDFDLVHFEWPQMALYADLFPRIPKLATEIEVIYAAQRTQLKLARGLWTRLSKYYEMLQTLYRELEMCRRVDQVVCVTEDDGDYLRSYLPEGRVKVVNTGVDTSFFSYQGREAMEPERVIFVGAFRHTPNVDAMRFFCREVFPLILEKRPSIEFYIVGSAPPKEIKDLAKHPNITVTGFVEDIREQYYQAQVVVVPLRTGVGIRGKVLEGWSAGRAMVATRLACQGIDAVHGENILIADEPDEIARWTVALLRHPEFAEALGRNGRETAERRYDWQPLGRSLGRLYEETCWGEPMAQPSLEGAGPPVRPEGGRRPEAEPAA